MAFRRQSLDKLVNNQITDLVVVFLVLASVTLLMAEAFVPEHSPVFNALETAGNVLTLIFVAELLLRFLAMPNRRRFLRLYWLDIIAVMPVARPLRILRVVRLLRLYRAGVLVNRRLLSLGSAFKRGRSELVAISVVMLIVLLLGAIGLNVAERRGTGEFSTIEGATWWSIYTLVSENPVSEVPKTFVGRLLGLLVVLCGVGFSATVTGVVSAGMIHRLTKGLEVSEMVLDDLRAHIVICGWNRIGLRLLGAFKNHPEYRNKPVVLIAEQPPAPELLTPVIDSARFSFLQGDATRMEVLRKAGIERAQLAVLLADKSLPRSDQDRDARTVLTALTIEKLNPKIWTTVELLSRDNESHLVMAGVEEIIVPDEYAGSLIAASSQTDGIATLLDDLLCASKGNSIHKTPIPAGWIGKDVGWVHQTLKQQYNAVLLSLERVQDGKRSFVNNPTAQTTLLLGDQLIFVADVNLRDLQSPGRT
jgi:voltage-gated potassium channel